MLDLLKFLPVGQKLYNGVKDVLDKDTVAPAKRLPSPRGKICKSEIRFVLLGVFEMACKTLSEYIIDDEQ